MKTYEILQLLFVVAGSLIALVVAATIGPQYSKVRRPVHGSKVSKVAYSQDSSAVP